MPLTLEGGPGAADDVRAVLIAGPTAGGKSAAALELASQFNGTIINADSMQVYQELRVVTARPNLDEERLVAHRLYGIVSVTQPYSVGRWLQDAGAEIAACEAQGRLPIVTGGTGLYFKALTEGIAPVPEIPEDVRVHWRKRAETMASHELHAELARRDPPMAEKLVPTDPQRIVRALEVLDATGLSLSDWQDQRAEPLLAPSTALRIVIAPEREALYAKIDQRFDAMIDAGAIEEIGRVLSLEVDCRLPAMQAHGLPELAAWLKGEISREEARQRAQTMSRRYAKRQLTWLRRFMADWRWFEEGRDAAEWARDELARRWEQARR